MRITGVVHSSVLLDHFENPRHAGELPPPAITVEVMNPVCGDILRLSALIEWDAVTDARFKARGCTACVAAGSVLTELLIGRAREELKSFKADEVDRALGGLIAESKHVAVLAADCVKALDAQLALLPFTERREK